MIWSFDDAKWYCNTPSECLTRWTPTKMSSLLYTRSQFSEGEKQQHHFIFSMGLRTCDACTCVWHSFFFRFLRERIETERQPQTTAPTTAAATHLYIIYHTNTQKIFCVDSTASLKWNAINNCRIPERHREKICLLEIRAFCDRACRPSTTTTVLQLEIMRVSETHAKILISFYLFIKWANKISSLWVLCFNCR